MKKYLLLLLPFLFLNCGESSSDENYNDQNSNARQDMRDFVIGISQKAKAAHSGFAIIPQNGIELISENGEADGNLSTAYLNAIDGHGQEDLFFGYDTDNVATQAEDNLYLTSFLDRSKSVGKTILVTDYCSSADKMTQSYSKNAAKGYVSFSAPERALNVIPTALPMNVNSDVVANLSQVKNFLYLINPEKYTSKQAFINAVKATNYDAVIMDLFLNNEQFTASEIADLKNKANGGKRLVICYMSIGEAEDYRYYWNSVWNSNKPSWMAAENPDWPGNFKVQYWNSDWQDIIYKSSDSYLNRILSSGFDGVYLDIIDAFEYFEQ